MPPGAGVVARLAGCGCFGVSSDGAEPGVEGSEPGLPQFLPDVAGRPGGLGRVGVADQPQPAVGHGTDVGPVGRAEGADLDDGLAAEVTARLAGRPPGTASSILTDRRAGRALEWEARNGVVQRLGARHGIPTPVSDVIVPLLAACGP